MRYQTFDLTLQYDKQSVKLNFTAPLACIRINVFIILKSRILHGVVRVDSEPVMKFHSNKVESLTK